MTTMKTKAAAALCGMTLVGAGLLSAGSPALAFGQNPTGTPVTTVQSTPASQSTTAATTQPAITVTKALEIARGQAQGDVREIELETDNGTLIYKVKLGNAKVSIDAESGTVLKVETKDTTESFPTAKITVDKAIEIAMGQAQGDFRAAELDTEGSAVIWDVEIGNSEVYIDAVDGTVIKIEQSDANHESDDDHGDSDHQDENENDSNQNDGEENDSASTAGAAAALYTIDHR